MGSLADPVVTICLWDVDGTLISTGGAGRSAMLGALEELTGRDLSWDGIEVSGQTDRCILHQFAKKYRLSWDVLQEKTFIAVYCNRLRRELGQSRGQIQKGVKEILELSRQRHERSIVHGLLTGNFQEAALIKLDHFGLDSYFPFGAFAQDGFDRLDLARAALRKAIQFVAQPVDPVQVLIIGDTPHDIRCAYGIGAQALAVATGNFSRKELLATGHSAVWENLGDVEAFFSFLKSLSARRHHKGKRDPVRKESKNVSLPLAAPPA